MGINHIVLKIRHSFQIEYSFILLSCFVIKVRYFELSPMASFNRSAVKSEQGLMHASRDLSIDFKSVWSAVHWNMALSLSV